MAKRSVKEIAQVAFDAMPHVTRVWVDTGTDHFHLRETAGCEQVDRDENELLTDDDLRITVAEVIKNLGGKADEKAVTKELSLTGLSKKNQARAKTIVKELLIKK